MRAHNLLAFYGDPDVTGRHLINLQLFAEEKTEEATPTASRKCARRARWPGAMT
ncbi:hypothetical protein MOTE_12450 [Moorella thermoacetica]|uniref:Uncharacterized protein n=1 Tax=Neomoorella thermoacetica TaxID=1525 RepID=A0A1J5NW75_NEOTH|nr:hypothetical protein MOTE_12450 [Moorella thermoacetica]